MTEGKTRWTSTDGRHTVEVRGALVLFDISESTLSGVTYTDGRTHYIADEFYVWENDQQLCIRHRISKAATKVCSDDREMLKDFHDKIIEAQNVALMYLYRMGRGR